MASHALNMFRIYFPRQQGIFFLEMIALQETYSILAAFQLITYSLTLIGYQSFKM